MFSSEEDPSSFPVDVKLTSLADWLRVRGHIKPDWILAVKQVRKKIAEALQEAEENYEIKELLCHSQITYYQSLGIISGLKKNEADTKPYASLWMKDWKEIAQLYQKNNLFLADAAFVLSNQIKHELPSLRKDLLLKERKIIEQRKKIEKNEKLAKQYDRLYVSQLKKRGLQGNNVELELLLYTNSLVKTLDFLDELILQLSSAVDYYMMLKEPKGEQPLVPLLKMYFLKGKRATAFEWFYGYAPEEAEKFNLEDALSQLAIENKQSEEKIDFNPTEDNIEVGEIQLVKEETPSRLPTVMESLPILENPTTRKELINEIVKLRCFLTAVEDYRTQEHPVSMLVLDIYKWNSIARQILDILTDPQTLEQLDLRYHPECLDEIVKEVEAPKKRAAFHRECAKLAIMKLEPLRKSYIVLVNTFTKVRQEAEKLEDRLCQDLAKLTDGGSVHLSEGVKSVPPL